MAVHTEAATARRADVGSSRPTRISTETKHALKTTEFWAFLASVAGILIASWIVTSGNGGAHNGDAFSASRAWLYVAILSAGYMIRRGLANSGSREPYTPDENTGPR